MQPAAVLNQKAARLALIAGAAILVAALGARLIGIGGRWLWFDELLSTTFVAWDLPQTLLANIRFDVHPPLYYLQLNLWALFGHSDLWMMLNSTFWSVAAVALLMWRANKLHGIRTALIAGLMLALAPPALAYGDQVRMYCFLMAMLLWAWIALDGWLDATKDMRKLPGPRFPWLASLNVIASQTAVIYSHSAGLAMISGVVLYAAWTLFQRRDIRTGAWWVATQSVVALGALPAVAIAVIRSVEHPVMPGLEDILQTWRFLAAGHLGPEPVGIAMGVILLGVLVWSAVKWPERRAGILTLILAPLAIAAVLSLAKPIWLNRIFVPVIPFICLHLGLFIASLLDARRNRGIAIAVALGFVALWSGVGLWGQAVREKGDGYKPASAYLHQTAKPGDLVLLQDDFAYWCLMYYYAGPQWGKPQQVYTLMPKWESLASRLGPGPMKMLGFGGETDSVDVGGVTVALWEQPEPKLLDAPTVYAVRAKAQPAVELPGYTRRASKDALDLVVETWTKTR